MEKAKRAFRTYDIEKLRDLEREGDPVVAVFCDWALKKLGAR